MRLATRQVSFLGCTPNPVRSWMRANGRENSHRRLRDGLLRSRQYATCCWTASTKSHGRIPGDASCRQRETGAVATEKSKLQRAFLESLLPGALKEEAFGMASSRSARRMLCKATSEFLLHYHGERPHQGLDHRILQNRGRKSARKMGVITCRERFCGGLLKYYYRQAA